ncbi:MULTISPECIES: hypothetical protein [unclassified Mesotoga]|uniref:hypothetical protein n=1 Tax=unclassified Mesotoga TaxID=1184398 RepID=UPI000C99BF69|nr:MULTISPECIES: hypothetical protein [unclassified Mesotoga]PNS41435.1 hypothetical protein RJ60_04855 [Mesotoga sp. B105.6.4]RAO96213.1 hypothetical protein M388_14820 [Mesotoga sp. Brook.08.YT.4.2.5.4.]
MNALERVKTRFGRAFDFLPSIYRLINNERLAKHFAELRPGYRPVGELVELLRTTKKKLPETIFEKMSLYFDWKAPLEMQISPVMPDDSTKTWTFLSRG